MLLARFFTDSVIFWISDGVISPPGPIMCLYNAIAVATFSVDKGLFYPDPSYDSGRPTILASLKMSPRATKYCSVNRSFNALPLSLPLSFRIESPIFYSDSTIDLASCVIFSAAPSPSKMRAYFSPSAMFTLDYRCPSDYKIVLLLTLSLSAYRPMLVLILSGGLMSLISYLMQWIPHFSLASFKADWTLTFKLSRSSNVLSSSNLPISLRIDV